MPVSQFQVTTVLKYFLFFFYFSAVYQLLCFLSNVAGFTGLREAFYLTFLFLIPVVLMNRYAKPLAGVLGILMWIASLPSLGYFFLYQQEFSQSVIFILFESNVVEGSEFLKTYFEWWMIPALLVYSYIPYRIWKSLSPIELPVQTKSVLVPLSLVISMHTFVEIGYAEENVDKAATKQFERMQSGAPWNLVFGYVSYRNVLQDMEQLLAQNKNLPPVSNLQNALKDDQETLVLVIGESTNRNRMGLYGYSRDTTPRLNRMKDELIVFNHVYSPRPYTIEALQQVLTFADEQHPDLYRTQTNLLNIMKQAGFETYWITNQQTQTKRNTMLTTFSKIADHQVYLNNNRSQNSSSYDEVVLKPFDAIIEDSEHKKKMIVVHLLGAHAKYDYRYPEHFARFDHAKSPVALNKKETSTYNSYDNAILYNDYVVSSLIREVSKLNHKASLVYLSDHGEEVYDDPKNKKLGRNEYAPTINMYAVPLIAYGNRYWKQERNIEEFRHYADRVYSSSDFLHTYCDFAGLDFAELDHSKSLVSEAFKPHDVWIGDPGNPKSMHTITEIMPNTRKHG